MVCIDTSFLVSLFVREQHTKAARDWMNSIKQVVILSELNELEFVNALELRVFRQYLSKSASLEIIAKFADLKSQEVFQVEYSERDVWRIANSLSRRYSPKIGLRTLDIWHVAYALCREPKQYASFDIRQRRLAEAVGLELNPMD